MIKKCYVLPLTEVFPITMEGSILSVQVSTEKYTKDLVSPDFDE